MATQEFSPKEQKRQWRMMRKEQKLAAKMARRQAKLERKALKQSMKESTGRKELLSRAEAVARIEQLLNALKEGKVMITGAGGPIELRLPDIVQLNVRARRKFRSEGLRISLRWPRQSSEEGQP